MGYAPILPQPRTGNRECAAILGSAAIFGMLALALAIPAAAVSQTLHPTPPAFSPQVPPRQWVQSAVDNELHIIDDDGSFPLRYRVHKIDAKGDVVREVIESRDGTVARLVERNGQPLTAAEDAAEKQRLNEVLASPEDFIKHHKRDNQSREYSTELVREMPGAMIFAYAPDQPQPPAASGRQIVIDFKPDPNYKPPSTICKALTGIEGRMWVDAASHRLTRIEGRIVQQVNFGWGGILARIQPGGSVEFEQINAGGSRWVYSHVDSHLSMVALWVKTIPMNDKMTASDFHLLPAPISFQDAVHTLLAMPVPTR